MGVPPSPCLWSRAHCRWQSRGHRGPGWSGRCRSRPAGSGEQGHPFVFAVPARREKIHDAWRTVDGGDVLLPADYTSGVRCRSEECSVCPRPAGAIRWPGVRGARDVRDLRDCAVVHQRLARDDAGARDQSTEGKSGHGRRLGPLAGTSGGDDLMPLASPELSPGMAPPRYHPYQTRGHLVCLWWRGRWQCFTRYLTSR